MSYFACDFLIETMVLAPELSAAPAPRLVNFPQTSDLQARKAQVKKALQDAEIQATVSYGPDAVLITTTSELRGRITALLEEAGIAHGVKTQ